MKKINMLFVMLFILAIALPVSAQHGIGIIGGLNLANADVDPPDEGVDYKIRAGFGIGGVLDLVLSENVALHLQPMYLQKGTKIEALGEELQVKVGVLEVPVFLKISLGTGTTKPYLIAGPEIGFLLSAKLTNGGEEDIKDLLKDIDFGLGFGAGVSFPAGNNSIFVEGRYALGLTNVNDDPDDPDTDAKTNGIQFMAGITFPLGGN